MKIFSKILTLLCLLVCVRAQGQECQRLIDSMDRMINRGDFQIGNLLQLADTVCLREVAQEDSLYGDLLNTHGVFLLTQGKPAEALPFFIRSKAINLKIRGFYRRDMGAIYTNEAYTYVLAGQFQKAIAACDSSLHIKNHLRDTSPSIGITLLTRANALIQLGKFEEAKQDLLLSIQNAKANHVETDHYQYLTRIGSLGLVHIYLGEWEEAIPVLKETVEISTRVFGEENGNTIVFMTNLTAAYVAIKEYKLAERYGAKALRLAEKVMPDHPQTNKTRQNLGVVFLETGRYSEALALLKKVKSIEDIRPGLDPAFYSTMLSNIGMVYMHLNDYATALPYCTKAREQMAKTVGQKSPRYALLNNNLAVCHFYMGNTELAESLANESFEIIKSFDESFLDYEKFAFSTLGTLKKSEAVLQRQQELTEIVRKKFGDNSKIYGHALMNYAASMSGLGQKKIKEALPILQYAEQILRSAAGVKSKEYLDVLRNLATCHERLGNTKESLTYYQKAIGLAEKNTGRENSFYAFLLQGAAAIEERQGKIRRAFAHYFAADTLYRNVTRRNFAVLSDAGRETFLADIRPELDRWHSFAWQYAASFPEIPGLLFDDQLSEKGQLLHSARSVLASLRGDTVLETQMTQWLGLRQTIDAQRGKLAQKDTHALYTAFQLDSLARVTDLIETYLTQKSKAFAAATQPVRWRDVQAQLAPDEAAIEFFHFNYSKSDSPTDSILYGALVLRPGEKQPHFIPLFEEKQLASILQCEGLATHECLDRNYLARPGDTSALYRLIWLQLESSLANTRRVWYAPSGLLHRVALPLIADPSGKRLVAEYDFQQMGSTRELAAAVPLPKNPPTSALIYACVSYPTDTVKMRNRTRECLGDPNWDGGRGGTDPLPNTLPEADTVAAQLRKVGAQVEVRIGYEALEDDAQQIGEGSSTSPDFLMFATHGFGADSLPLAFRGRFPPNNPMYSSWLLMAGAERVDTGGVAAPGFQDGILTAREIGDLNLQGTRLAVLSACESGLGEANSSEGVYGLQRAFKVAGARQVLVTLWKIPDSSETQEFVGKFCARWLESGDARAALRETQLDFSKRGKSVQVWGAWVLI